MATNVIFIDADVAPLATEARTTRPVLQSRVGLAVATALLANPDKRMSVRDVVSFTGHSLGAVHLALRSLRDEGLVDGEGRPLRTDLFWEASGEWRPRRVPLHLAPKPLDASRTDQLDLGLEDVESRDGWALSDTLAANAFGAFPVVRRDYPPDFYVPNERTVRVCRHLYGDAITPESRGATVAVPPVRWACMHRIDVLALGRSSAWDEFPSVHPVIAALDLSIDEGRGREILDQWEPPLPYVRVW